MVLRSAEDARVELMLNLSEGLLSGIVSSCSAGRRLVTIEAAGSAVSCLVPVKTPRAMTAEGKWGQSEGNRESGESIKIKDVNHLVMPALILKKYTHLRLKYLP